MIQEERVSKLVTEILELKDWNNWSAIPWNYKWGGRGRRTSHINCLLRTDKCHSSEYFTSARLTTRNLTWSGTCGASGVGWRVREKSGVGRR